LTDFVVELNEVDVNYSIVDDQASLFSFYSNSIPRAPPV